LASRHKSSAPQLQYEAAFRENEIDDTVLPRLTPEDLRELGVASVGHRRKLLDAIAALRAEASAPTPPFDPSLATDEAAKDTAERRQVTVMFSDLVGSTALSARMDPEDLREIISAYQRCVAETVRRFGGFVARYMGEKRRTWRHAFRASPSRIRSPFARIRPKSRLNRKSPAVAQTSATGIDLPSHRHRLYLTE